jgi:hypothetical protein
MLMLFGLAEATPTLWAAASAITLGALLAAKDLLFSRPAASVPTASHV